MSIFASILRSVYKLSGAKKAFALPEDALRKEIEKQNRHRGVFTPTDHKAHYAGLQRSARPIRQRLFPFSRKDRRRHDENADCKDQIWRQAMKILVYGAGVLGCNLARNLFHAGKDVTLLARGNWAEEIKQNGLRIKDKF